MYINNKKVQQGAIKLTSCNHNTETIQSYYFPSKVIITTGIIHFSKQYKTYLTNPKTNEPLIHVILALLREEINYTVENCYSKHLNCSHLAITAKSSGMD